MHFLLYFIIAIIACSERPAKNGKKKEWFVPVVRALDFETGSP